MTAASFPLVWRGWPGRAAEAQSPARTDPDLPRAPAPVLIQDAVTPWGGETLLLARLRAERTARAAEE